MYGNFSDGVSKLNSDAGARKDRHKTPGNTWSSHPDGSHSSPADGGDASIESNTGNRIRSTRSLDPCTSSFHGCRIPLG